MKEIKEIKSKVSAIRDSFSDKKNITEDVHDKFIEDLKETQKLYGKKLDDFVKKKTKKKENKKNLFAELLDLSELFVGKDIGFNTDDKYFAKQKMKIYAEESIKIAMNSSKQILQDNIKKIFFAGEGICGADAVIAKNSINLNPKEFDFLNLLTIDPNTNIGKAIYENTTTDIGREKINKKLYDIFNNGSTSILKSDGSVLFSINWNATNQTYQISGLKQNGTVQVVDFFNDYFSNIEFPDFESIIKSSMLLTIQGDNINITELNLGLNYLNRLLEKLFAVCNSPTNRNLLNNQNPTDLFDENDEDVEDYFDFDVTDGIDFESEDAKLRGVLKFINCNNFEIPVNTKNFEDFSYSFGRKSINDIVNETLEKVATNAFDKSDGSVPLSTYNLSLKTDFIINLPKALMLNLMTPKLMLPTIIIHKLFNSLDLQTIDVKISMKKLSKLFYSVTKEIFWLFIREFWTRIKAELLAFVRYIVIQIIKSKYKRYTNILTAILETLKNIGINNIDNCQNLFNTILKTLENATLVKGRFNLPNFLLAFSNTLPGLSKQRMLLDTVQILDSLNIDTGDVFGERNNLIASIDSIFDSMLQNIDKYSYVKSSNQPAVLASPVGPIPIPPGIITISGKLI